MKKVMMKFVLGCCLATLITGCVSYGTVLNQFKSQIVKGKTTKTEVLQKLGNPDQKIDLGQGQEQFSYIKEEYMSNPVSFVSGKSKNTEFWLTFDTNNAVADFGERPTSKAKNYFGGQQ